MPGFLYSAGRGLQLLGMWLLLVAIVEAGEWGPSPRMFAAGVGVFGVGWLLIRRR